MEDVEVYEKIDKVLSDLLSTKTLKQMYDEITEHISIHKDEYQAKSKEDSSRAFQLSNEMGSMGEMIVKKYFETLGYTYLSQVKDITKDLIFLYNGKQVSFEIKTDVKHLFINKKGEEQDTKNLVVEYSSRGKPSGIEATTADYLVTFYPALKELWIAKVSKLKKIIEEHKTNEELIMDKKNVGDKDSKTHIYLLRRNKEIIKNAFNISELTNVLR